jgi:hypothetical protein
MTIQAALVGGQESQSVREELIALRMRGQEALRQRFERAKEEGDLARRQTPAIWHGSSQPSFKA